MQRKRRTNGLARRFRTIRRIQWESPSVEPARAALEELGTEPESPVPIPDPDPGSYRPALYSSRFGVPVMFPVITPLVALVVSQLRIVE